MRCFISYFREDGKALRRALTGEYLLGILVTVIPVIKKQLPLPSPPPPLPQPPGGRALCVSLCVLWLLLSSTSLNGKTDQRYFPRKILVQLHGFESCPSNTHVRAEPEIATLSGNGIFADVTS